MARGVGGQSPANVEKYLAGVNYPAKKEDIVNKAQNNGAPEEVLEVIKQLPMNQFGGPQDVMKAYGQQK